jgi:hypothetical protein
MAKKIDEIRGLLHNHTRVEAVKAVGTECYEEKDSNYWFEEWEMGMQSGKMRFQDYEDEVTKTQQEREEEEDKMEEMRAIWEDRRMIKRL